MFKIAEKYPLNTSKTIFRVSIEAPLVARSAQPGQFAIFRLDEYGERFPLTIADYDPEVGTVSFNFQPRARARRCSRSWSRATISRTSSAPWAAPRR